MIFYVVFSVFDLSANIWIKYLVDCVHFVLGRGTCLGFEKKLKEIPSLSNELHAGMHTRGAWTHASPIMNKRVFHHQERVPS